MDGINGDLGKPYVNVHNDNEHIDSYYSRSLGNAPPYLEFNEEVKKKYRSYDNRGCVERSYRHSFAEKRQRSSLFRQPAFSVLIYQDKVNRYYA